MKRALLALLLASVCQADVIFNNITGDKTLGGPLVSMFPGDPIDPAETFVAAVQFTAAVNSTVTEASVFMFAENGRITYSLFSDQNGLPGSELATLGTLTFTDLQYGVFGVSPSTAVGISAGTPYWLVLSPVDVTSRAEWLSTPTGTLSEQGTKTMGDPIQWQALHPPLQFAIDAAPTATSPEPANLSFIGLCGIGLMSWRLRKRRS